MREFGAVVRREREAKSLSQSDLAEAAGIARSYVSKIERGEVDGLGYDVFRDLIAVLGLNRADTEALLRDEPAPRAVAPTPEVAREIPVVADISAGPRGGGIIDHWEYVPLSDTRGHLLRAGRCTGGCMAPEIEPGDVIIFDAANTTPRDGQRVVATVPDPANERGRGVVKRFYRIGNRIKLDCNVGEPILLPADQVRIEGVVVEVRRKYAA